MNHASICGTMMAAFMLVAMLVNAASQSALSNDVVTYDPELRFGMRFRIIDDPICHESSSDDNRVCVWKPSGESLNPAFAFQRHIAPTAGVMV
ncbi:hypothetical protein TNCV_4010631 [Trichonephila clavipes]|nr:hypothetical protein TNCV_4010631 [Trichonephila clavipes]